FEYDRFVQDLRDYQEALKGRLDRKVRTYDQELRRYAEILRRLSPEGRIRDRLLKMDQYQDTLNVLMDRKLKEKRHQLDIDVEKLKGLSPLDRLRTGYSYVASDEGSNVRSIGDVQPGEALNIYVSDGMIRAKCEGTQSILFLGDAPEST
ncbi:MAG: exodeoxyribonuclease VII large subunit, partial [Clostridia bacterium]|nr:exodeoxyribonuclease VII large subunit [Clostridia bacterium]